MPGSTFRVDPSVIWTVATTFAALLLMIGFLLIRAKRQGPTSGIEAMVGEQAVVHARITAAEAGTIHLRGAYWKATCLPAGELALEAGVRVRVVRMNGTRAVVAPLDP